MLQGKVLEMGIFSEHAPYYYNRELWVIPCDGKKPLPVGWSEYCDLPPSRKVRDEWLARYPDANVGLPLGPASGMVAVDIDTDDPDELASIKRTLPPSSYERIGKKGCALFYKYNGEKTFSIQGKVDFLSTGRQVILPPSIHPETGQQYYWKGAAL